MPIRFQVDADFYDHPKVLDLSDAAVALWTKAGSYCAAKTSDGFVAQNALAVLSKTPTEAAEELRRSGLWHKVRGGYQFHQWEHRNLTRERIEADKESDRARKRRDRASKNNSSDDPRSPVDNSSLPRGTVGTPQAKAQNVRSESERSPEGIRAESGGIPGVSVSVSVSESVSGSGRGAGPSPAAGAEPHGPRPEERCREHQDDPDPPACRRCKTAREAAEAWDASYAVAYAMAEAHGRDNRPQCPVHPGQLAHNCGPCRSERIGGRS